MTQSFCRSRTDFSEKTRKRSGSESIEVKSTNNTNHKPLGWGVDLLPPSCQAPTPLCCHHTVKCSIRVGSLFVERLDAPGIAQAGAWRSSCWGAARRRGRSSCAGWCAPRRSCRRPSRRSWRRRCGRAPGRNRPDSMMAVGGNLEQTTDTFLAVVQRAYIAVRFIS